MLLICKFSILFSYWNSGKHSILPLSCNYFLTLICTVTGLYTSNLLISSCKYGENKIAWKYKGKDVWKFTLKKYYLHPSEKNKNKCNCTQKF